MEHLLPQGKFALLLHKDKGPLHFDLVLEGKDMCPTFQFEQKELVQGIRIKDHRKNYLSFEGLISPEKGSVKMIEKGEYKYAEKILQLKSPINKYSFSNDPENLLIKTN